MYHWRVLEGAAAPGAKGLSDESADVAGMVSYWGGSEAMGSRLRAIADATASVLIFLEYLPWSLSTWLDMQLGSLSGAAEAAEATEAACAMVERGLTVDVPLMNRLGLLHGDAHLGNILTDGHRLYFADMGLATSKRFALSPDELSYLNHNATLDQAYVLAKWVNWLVRAWTRTASSPLDRMEVVRRVAQGQASHPLIPDLPACVAAAIHRHAPIATVVNDFYVRLHGERRDAPYPRDAVETLLLTATA
jgi:hypothetical protein